MQARTLGDENLGVGEQMLKLLLGLNKGCKKCRIKGSSFKPLCSLGHWQIIKVDPSLGWQAKIVDTVAGGSEIKRL